MSFESELDRRHEDQYQADREYRQAIAERDAARAKLAEAVKAMKEVRAFATHKYELAKMRGSQFRFDLDAVQGLLATAISEAEK